MTYLIGDFRRRNSPAPGGNTFLASLLLAMSCLQGVTHFLPFLLHAVSFRQGPLGEVWEGSLKLGPVWVGLFNSRVQYMVAHFILKSKPHFLTISLPSHRSLLTSRNLDFLLFMEDRGKVPMESTFSSLSLCPLYSPTSLSLEKMCPQVKAKTASMHQGLR